MINVLISPGERNLIADIREIAYGEIYEANAEKPSNLSSMPLSEKEAKLIRALRDNSKIDKIIIHDNEPASAEITGVTQGGRKYLKKLRF